MRANLVCGCGFEKEMDMDRGKFRKINQQCIQKTFVCPGCMQTGGIRIEEVMAHKPAHWWNVKLVEKTELPGFWGPEPGEHVILVKRDKGTRTVHTEQFGDYEALYLDIEEADKLFTWSIRKGTTRASAFGQLALVAKQKGGLEGQRLKVTIGGYGKDRRYTVKPF